MNYWGYRANSVGFNAFLFVDKHDLAILKIDCDFAEEPSRPNRARSQMVWVSSTSGGQVAGVSNGSEV